MALHRLNFLDTDVIIQRLTRTSKKLGMRLEDFWRYSALDRRTIRSWVNGKRTPTLVSLQALQQAINLALELRGELKK